MKEEEILGKRGKRRAKNPFKGTTLDAICTESLQKTPINFMFQFFKKLHHFSLYHIIVGSTKGGKITRQNQATEMSVVDGEEDNMWRGQF